MIRAFREALIALLLLGLGVFAFSHSFEAGYAAGYVKGHEESALDGYEIDADLYADSVETATRALQARAVSE